MKSQNEAISEEVGFDSESDERDDAVIDVALKWSTAVLIVVAAAAAGAIYFWLPKELPPPVKETELARVELREASSVEPPRALFTDVTKAAGIDFHHQNAAAGDKLMPETMGGGCAFFDFDADGDQDLLLINGLERWPDDALDQAKPVATAALYRNNGRGQFDDVTTGSGLDAPIYGMSAAVGDYDNDGLVDVFLSALGSNRLLHNEGDGRFNDVTDTAGVSGGQKDWSASCGWFDFDNDGDLDLLVGNYLQWTREYDQAQNFQLTGGGRAYGRPQNFEGTFPFLYRNNGDGTFSEIAEQAGLHVRNPDTGAPVAKTLGVVLVDVDRDHQMDIVVANDTVQNFLFHNQGDGTFQEKAAASGIAFDMSGNARGAMGIDVERFRDNDALGVAIGNFSNEMTALYVSYGNEMLFMDEAIATGLGPKTRLELTFGVFYIDYDLDGRLDLFAANGHLEEEINRVQPSQFYEQPPQLFWNCGSQQDTEFVAVGAEHCGDELLKPMVGRGASYADIDGDGDQDILIAAAGRPPRLLRNDQNLGRHWLRFKLVGKDCNRDAIGATVEVRLSDRTLLRRVAPTRSYISQVELPVTFGLGESKHVESVAVHWPDGTEQHVEVGQVDRLYVIEQDAGVEQEGADDREGRVARRR